MPPQKKSASLEEQISRLKSEAAAASAKNAFSVRQPGTADLSVFIEPAELNAYLAHNFPDRRPQHPSPIDGVNQVYERLVR